MKPVLVHECFDAGAAPRISFSNYGLRFSREIFVHTPNVSCACRHRITYAEREAMLAREDAVVMIPFESEFPDWRHVVVLRKKSRTNAQSITDRNIKSAYLDGNLYQQERIDAYGATTQLMFVELGAELRVA